MRWVREYHVVIMHILLAALAIGISYALAEIVFQRVALNADEHSYLFQAQNFIDGYIARPFPPNSTAFNHKMIIVSPHVGWLSRYPFAHPLFLVPGVLFGNPYLWVALAAGLSLLLMMRAAAWLGNGGTGIAAGILLCISPFFYFYHGTLLSHSSGLLATSTMLWAYIRWRKTDQWRWAVLAGLAWGFFLNNRTYTALLIAVPFAIDALWTLYRNWSVERLRGTACFAGASFAGLLALLLYNYLSVGDLGTMTYLVYNPTEKLGFGPRIYGRVDHTLARGLENVWGNVKLLNVWLLGFSGSGLVWLMLAFLGWTREWTRLCLGAILMVVLGYAYFWYVGPRDAGPSYYFELLPFIVVSGALGIQRIVRHCTVWPALMAMMIALFFGVPLSLERGQELQAFNAPRRAFMDVIAAAPPQSLIFVNPAEHREAFAVGNDMIFNPRGLDSDPLIAHWMPLSHRAMVAQFPDRTPYRFAFANGELQLEPAPPDVTPIELDYSIVRTGFHQGRNERNPDTGHWMRVAQAPEAEADLILFGSYQFLHPASYVLTFDLRLRDLDDADQPVLRLDVAANFAESIVMEQEVMGGKEEKQVAVLFSLDQSALIEPRVWFLGQGHVEVRHIRLVEQP